MVRTADLPSLEAVTDGSLLVSDRSGTGTFRADALKAYATAGLATAASVTAETLARTTSVTALSAKAYGAVGDGIADDTAELQAALDAATAASLPLFIPAGRYLISAALNVRRGVRIFGAGAEPQAQQFTVPMQTGGNGTWFVLDGTHLVSVFNIAPAGVVSQQNEAFGVEISQLGVYHTQPAPAPGWAPYNYPAAILLGGASDIRIRDITLLNPTIGIRTTAEGGRVTIERVRGQPLFQGMVFDNATDVVRVTDCHFWCFWSLDADVLSYQKGNAVAFQLGRIDNPIFAGNFAIWYRIFVQCTATASGVVNKAAFVGCGADSCAFMLVINDAIGGHSLLFTNCYGQGDPPASNNAGVLIAGVGGTNVVTFVNCLLAKYGQQLVAISATGTGNRVQLLGSNMTGWDNVPSGDCALSASAGNIILADSACVFFSTNNPAGITSGAGFSTREPVIARGGCIVVSGTTSITANHSFGFSPTAIMLTPRGTLGAAKCYWWTATATQYTVHVDVDPAVDVTFDVLLIAEAF